MNWAMVAWGFMGAATGGAAVALPYLLWGPRAAIVGAALWVVTAAGYVVLHVTGAT